ncbi:MAG TPA: PKD domain-containing protein [Flavobacteriales bacterium]|nr:PKD domain-containing protein [Flavobacteriales bacterium]
MRYTKLLTVSCAAVFFASCGKNPTANFTPSNDIPLINENVKFNNGSTEATIYEWDFGDGEQSSEQSPEHAYQMEGTYTVTLKVYSADRRRWASKAVKISVQHPPALFTGTMNGNEVKLMSGVNGYIYTYGNYGAATSGIIDRVYFGTVGSYTGPVINEEMRFELDTIPIPTTYTLADISPLFHTAIRVQEYYFSPHWVFGIRLIYRAPNGVIWSSDAGTADQTGSSFVLTYTKDITDAGKDAEFFKAHVNCKLYDGLGGVMTVTNGTLEFIMANT